MKKFEEIVKHHKDNIYGWWDNISIVQIWNYIGRAIHLTRYNGDSLIISIDELLSLESSFLQACKWKNHINWPIEFVTECEDDNYVDSFRFEDWDRQYHAMRLSILSQEEKIKYLEENVIVE